MVDKRDWKNAALWILFAEAVGALTAWLLREDIQIYNLITAQPQLAPPPAVFPIVWALLYALMGFGAARIYAAPPSGARTGALRLFFAQLAANVLWSVLFFRFRAFGAAFVWILLLWLTIFSMTAAFRKLDVLSARLQLPYLLWVAFAAFLNLRVWQLN